MKTKNIACFRIKSLQDLTNYIIPHFTNYPLLSKKAADFILFKQIITLIQNKVHLTDEGIQQIINLRAFLNWGLSDLLKSHFPNYNPMARPLIFTPNNLAGSAHTMNFRFY